MRIVIDMQGAQSESRSRGIGRYTLSFAQAIARNRGEHEVIVALSSLFSETIEPIREALDGLLPQESIRVWHAPGPVRELHPANANRREVAELIREAFLASLMPDVIHISSLFEGYVDDAVTSIGRFDRSTPVSVSLYDLIPLLNAEHYLKPDPEYDQYYRRKVKYLGQAAICLTISEFTRQEGLVHLGIPEGRVVNVSTAIEPYFQPLCIEDEVASQLRQTFGLTRPFILYVGGADERKNLPRLIHAFAALPTHIRADHQLLLVGRIPQGDLANLQHQAKHAGLKPDELSLRDYVSDEELVCLYNLCKLFVLPSWHEGFGLPVLEAMACGAPVIGANTSSLPEVIGLDIALFDPIEVTAITAKMARALEDDIFRTTLREHGLLQAKRFSWDETANRAIAAWGLVHGHHESANSYIDRSRSSAGLIETIAKYIPTSESTALITLAACLAQNQNAGIERQLMLDVSELSQRDAATGVQRVVRSYLKALLRSFPTGFRVEPVYATRDDSYRYARRFTQNFLGQDAANVTDEPVQWQRGDVFFGLDMQHHVQLAHKVFYRQLQLNGVTVKFLIYDLLPIQLASHFKDANAKELHEQWLEMVSVTDGAICISKATADAYKKWIDKNAICPTPNFQITWVHIGGDIEDSQPSQGLPSGAPTCLKTIRSRPSFLCVATLEPRKRQVQIVEAIQLLWDEGLDVNLVLVGRQGWKSDTLAGKILNHPEKDQRLFWLQGISDEYLELVYAASTCLIAASTNEGFGLPIIEAARHQIPIIARDIPVFREVAGDCAFYFTGDTPLELSIALKTWLGLSQEGHHPKSNRLRWSTWKESAEKLEIVVVREHYPRQQLLVDVSELVQRDVKSGIQRVVRSILAEWLNHPPLGYRIEPVYATVEQGYRYARRFTQGFLGCPGDGAQDESIDYMPGDVFVGLDFQPHVIWAQRSFYQTLRRHGVRVLFVVYDLLCIQIPRYFTHGAADGFARWLQTVAESDGALCISKAVADELADWVNENGPKRQRHFRIDWFYLGADVDNSSPTKGLPVDAENLLNRLRGSISFLMIGTLEPRKGHMQVLEAFEQLWRSGMDLNLVIVGKQGWLVKNLVDRLCVHPELDRRLFWLEGISDEYLEKVYAASTCLIAASYGEGFGLPLIEAAQHKLPIIARDIPVFREVGGEHAFYFQGVEPSDLAQAIVRWLTLFENCSHPRSAEMPRLTWRQSAAQLLEVLGLADSKSLNAKEST